MKIGTITEIKDNEYRVGLVPGGVKTLTAAGHEVLVQDGAGLGSGITNKEFASAGATILTSVDEVIAAAEMVIKVKEPLAVEVEKLREGQILFTYLHLAALPELTDGLLERGVTGIAYETITSQDGSLPLLTPMSEVAGRMSIQKGAHYLEKPEGGCGILVGGVPGVPRGRIAIIGGGVVGINACKMAIGLGAQVTVLERSPERMQYLDDIFEGRITTLMSNPITIEESVLAADLVVGAVLIPGASAPKIVTRNMIREMKTGIVRHRRRSRRCKEACISRIMRDAPARRPTATRHSSSTVWSTTVSPTCRAPFRGRLPSLSRTLPCPSRSIALRARSSRIMGSKTPSARTRICSLA